jgi:hypothetical protein
VVSAKPTQPHERIIFFCVSLGRTSNHLFDRTSARIHIAQLLVAFQLFASLLLAQAATTSLKAMNGWKSDSSAFAYGLPGSISPIEDFDPLGFAAGATEGEMKRYREAEVTHGRVAMLAALGFLVGENFHPLFGTAGTELLAIDSLTEVRKVLPQFFEIMVIVISGAEVYRALCGWSKPDGVSGVAPGDLLTKDYYPGDIGFDPLGLKPTDAEEYATIQTKELQNGRLAMLGIAGMVAQELVDHLPILKNDFGI